MLKMYGVVYKAKNIFNGKCYIGQTKNSLESRIKAHIKHARKGKSIFNRAVKKYSSENFNWSIIDYAYDANDLDNKEIFWISFYKTTSPNGYNLKLGGHGYTATEEVKRTISDKTKEAMNRPQTREKFLYANSHKKDFKSHVKGRTHEEVYGKEKAVKISEKISSTL